MPAFAPVPWDPGPTPDLAGPFEANDRLAAATRWPVGGVGPEDVVVDDEGWVFTGLADGRIRRLGPDGGDATTIAVTGGRPLGVELHPEDGLVVCDADRGLLHVDGRGKVHDWVTTHEGERLLFTNNAAVASDGIVYFSDTSRRWSIHEFNADILEQSATGRLFARHPDGSVEVLADGLAFANGVALSADEQSVFVAETARYRIRRFDLASRRLVPWVEGLPGFPDNLTRADGVVWVAFPRPRDRVLDALLPRPWARRVVHALPTSLQPKPSRHGFLLGLAESDGSVVHNLQDTTGSVAVTTSARVVDGRLFVGSLTEPTVAVADLADL
ncbi:MAG: SMP-30/gluconolactonase/LRE family protein [Acidimicrobiia bacterium]